MCVQQSKIICWEVKSSKFYFLVLIGALLMILAPPICALTPIEVAKLTASDGASSDRFGISVALDGDTALIGVLKGRNSGSAYVFTRNAGVWTEQAKLTASDGASSDSFGASVAVDGDTALIGANEDDDNGDVSGSAYVFTRSAGVWTEQAKLTASDGAVNDNFGRSVAVDVDTALVGAASDDDNGTNSGSAYVFTLNDVVSIDIMPGYKRKVINPRATGGIWVAVLSDTGSESPFDPSSQVDISSVEFGPDGAKATRHKVKDINKDGLGDLLLRYKIPATGIACGDTEVTLTGETFSGQSLTGTDVIKTVGCEKSKAFEKKKHKEK
jgi:hypothetical protein